MFVVVVGGVIMVVGGVGFVGVEDFVYFVYVVFFLVLVLFCEQCLYSGFGFFVMVFVVVEVDDLVFFVDQVEGWLVVIVIGFLGVVVVVLCDGVLDVEVFDCFYYIFGWVFVGIFGCMYVDDYEFFVFVFFVLVFYVR